MPYTRRNAAPYVPSPSETDLKARNIGITESLTASNINTLNLSVLGDVNGVLNAPQGVEVGGTLKVPTVNTTPINTDITIGPLSAGLITIDKINGKMYFSKERDNATGQTARDSGVVAAKGVDTSTGADKAAKLALIEGAYTATSTFNESLPFDYGVLQVYNAALAAVDAAAVAAAVSLVPVTTDHEFSKFEWVLSST